MEKKTWDSILKKIAKEKGFSDWSEYVFLTDKPTSEMYEEAAQRFADQEKKAYAREAVKADRERIIEKRGSLIGCALMGERYKAYILDETLRNLPIELP